MVQFTSQEKETIVQKFLNEVAASQFSPSRFAGTVGLSPADITNISNRKYLAQPHLIGDAKWIKLARIAGFDKRQQHAWQVAETHTFKYMTKQLAIAQAESLSSMLVDDAGLGKSVAAKWYAKNKRYAFLIDCSDHSTKSCFIRAIAQAVGVGSQGKLNELLSDAIYAIRQMESPILILDEAGDLEDKAYLILKRLYNALEGDCGFYLIGADGMKRKIKNGVAGSKLGFVEVFSRFRRNFKKVTPELLDEKHNFYRTQAIAIAEANGLTKSEAESVAKMLTKNGQLNDMRFVADAVKGMLKLKAKNTNEN